MLSRYRAYWLVSVLVIGSVAAGWLGSRPAAAGDLDKLDISLKLIPEDAAFYSATLRCREQFEAIGGSRAWAKLKAMPIVQMGLGLYHMQAVSPNSVPGKIQAAMADPEVRKLLDLARDMVSQDVFMYGESSCTDTVELSQQILGAMRYGPMVLQLTGEAKGLSGDKINGMVIMAALSENLNLIKIPDLVMGFRLSNPAAASEQLSNLENQAKAVLESQAETKGRFQRNKVGEHEYLTLRLDGEMVPWDQLPLEYLRSLESKPGDVDKLIARLKQLKLTMALGVRGDYLLLAIGSSPDVLARLGSGKRLMDRSELKPLAKFADKRLASISYLSKAMAGRLSNGKKDIDDLLGTLHELLPQAKLPADQQAQIRKDASALAEDLKSLVPEPGALLAFGFLTEQGIEGYQYQWGGQPRLDGSKPLSLLEHVGGDPAAALVGRGKFSLHDYELLAKWLKIGYGYFEQYGLPSMPTEERDKFQQFAAAAKPEIQRIDKANREMLIPALADGQKGVVLDKKLQSKQFVESLPATEKPMPMIEPAIVVGVSSAELLGKAFGEYRAAANGLINALRQVEPNVPAELEIPEATITPASTGKIYGYPLPGEWGVDEQVVPNFGLSDTVGVFSLSRGHTERLLSTMPLNVGGVLAKTDRPLAAAGFCDWAGLVDVFTPWVDLAIRQLTNENPGVDAQAGGISAQVHTLLDVLKVFRTITGESYFEDGAMVSHTLLEIRDVAE